PAQVDLFHDCRGHVAVDDLADDRRALFDTDAERLGALVANRLALAGFFEFHLPAEVIVGIDVAQDHVRIRDRWFRAAEIETRRARHRSGAARSDLHAILQQLVDVGDRATARADR